MKWQPFYRFEYLRLPPVNHTVVWVFLMNRFFKDFVRVQEGASLIEYALMVALIAIVCIAAVTSLGSSVNTKFRNAANCVSS